MTMIEPIKRKRGLPGLGAIVAAVVALSLLSGCVVYVPYSGPPPRYHYWR